MQQVAILTVILRLRVAVKVEVETDLVEYSGDDLLLDRLRVRRVCMLVRAPPAVCDGLFDGSTQNGISANLYSAAHRALRSHHIYPPVAFGIQVVLDNSLGL